MKLSKKILALLLAATCCFALLTACNNTTGGDDTAIDPNDGIDETVNYDALKGTTIKVAATPAPHAEILEIAKKILAQKDITLDIVEFTDYVQPNTATEQGDVDANYFQHLKYLDDFNTENDTHLVSAGVVHYEPLGIYAGNTASLDALPDGATVAVPNDTTNEGRALRLLADNGLITLPESAGVTATVTDITENPKNLNITEVEAAQLPRVLNSADIAVINGNYAIEANLKISDALAVEANDSMAAEIYANALVVKEGNEDSDATKALYAAITSEAVRQYIESTYNGAVVPLF